MAKGTRAYAGCNGKGDERMHNRNEWIRTYGDLMRMDAVLHENSITDSLAVLVIRVLMMLVEDKIKE